MHMPCTYVSISIVAIGDINRTQNNYVPAEPLLGSEVLLAYLKTPNGSQLLKYIPPTWAGLHSGTDVKLDAEDIASAGRRAGPLAGTKINTP